MNFHVLYNICSYLFSYVVTASLNSNHRHMHLCSKNLDIVSPWFNCSLWNLMFGSSICMQSLYNEGGRKFWLHNTGPFGCLPKFIALSDKKDLDSFGCISSFNSAARLFNEALYHSSQKLRTELKDAALVYVDIYAIKNDLIANGTKYGNSNKHFLLINFLFYSTHGK